MDYTVNPAERERIFNCLVDEERTIRNLPAKHRTRIREEEELLGLLREANALHSRQDPEPHAVPDPDDVLRT